MSELGSLNIRITASMDQMQQELDKAKSHLSDFEKSMGRLSRTITAFAGLWVFRQVTGAIGDMIKTTVDFEDTMIDVAKTTGMSTEQTQKLALAYRQMALELPFTAQELAKIGVIAGQMNIQGQESITEFTRTVAMMASATVLSVEESAAALGTIGSLFKLTVDKYKNLGSTIALIADETIANERDIVNGLMRLGPAISQLKISPAEGIALIAMLKELGVSSERAGTVLTRAFSQMASKSAQVAQIVELDLTTMTKLINEHPTRAFLMLLEAISKIPSEATRLNVLNDLLGTTAARVGVLGQNVEKTRIEIEHGNKQMEEGTRLAEEHAKKMEGLSSQWKVVRQTWAEAGMELTNSLLPQLKFLAEALRSVATWVRVAQEGWVEFFAHTFFGKKDVGQIDILGDTKKAEEQLKNFKQLQEIRGDLTTTSPVSNTKETYSTIIKQLEDQIKGYEHLAEVQKQVSEIKPRTPVSSAFAEQQTKLVDNLQPTRENESQPIGLLPKLEAPELPKDSIINLQLYKESLDQITESYRSGIIPSLQEFQEQYANTYSPILEQRNIEVALTQEVAALEAETQNKSLMQWQKTMLAKKKLLEDFKRATLMSWQEILTGISGALGTLEIALQGASEMGKEWAKAAAAIALAMAIINTAQGITRAYADYPWPASMIIGGIIGAAGALQVATIAKQKFQYGGLIDEPTMMIGMRSGKQGIAGEAGIESIVPMGKRGEKFGVSDASYHDVHIHIATPFSADDSIFWDNIAREHIVPAITRNSDRVVS